MSTTYLLRKPIAVASLEGLCGWRVVGIKDGRALSDGENYAQPFWSDDEGVLFGFERYTVNDVSALVVATDAVSEHDEDDPDYGRLFNEED